MLTTAPDTEVMEDELPRPAVPSWGVMLKQLTGVPCPLPAAVPQLRKARTHLFDGPDEE